MPNKNKKTEVPQCVQTSVTSSPFRVLNLYACLGGNRYKWDEVANIEVTAVELDEELAKLYQERFPNDTVIVADAHQYLLDNYKNFDFIWSSPPCPTHSRIQISMKTRMNMKYPDMKLYEEILLLDSFFDGKYCIENVIPFYEPLIPAKKRGRHLYWTNFNLPNDLKERTAPPINTNKNRKANHVLENCNFHKIDLSGYNGKQSKEKISRNLVDFEAGKTIFETALGIIHKSIINQTTIFDDVA
jgi:DNA (cytosine-5)-methyltransferase 1